MRSRVVAALVRAEHDGVGSVTAEAVDLNTFGREQLDVGATAAKGLLVLDRVLQDEGFVRGDERGVQGRDDAVEAVVSGGLDTFVVRVARVLASSVGEGAQFG